MLSFAVGARLRAWRRAHRTVAVLAIGSLACAMAPVFRPIAVQAISPSGSELYGDHNPGETGGSYLAAGMPVDLDTGNLVVSATDMSVPGRGRNLLLARAYNSLDAATATTAGLLGNGWSWTYGRHLVVDPVSGAVTVHEENGSTVTFQPAGNGSYAAAPQVTAALVANPGGGYTYTLRDQTSETFNATGVLVSESDRHGYVTQLVYTGSQLTSVVDPAGRSLVIAYDASGRVHTVTDPIGRVVTYGYDAGGNLSSVTDVGGHVTGYSYDAAHLLRTVTDANGGVTTVGYDVLDRVTGVTDPMGHTRSVAYGAAGQATLTDGNGWQTVEQFSNHRPASMTRGANTAQPATWTYITDQYGNISSVLDPYGGVWTTTWDAHGNRTAWSDPQSHSYQATYDALNDPLQVVDPTGVATTYSYTGGDLTSVSRWWDAGGHSVTVAYAYDPNHPGDLLSVTDAMQNTWQFSHDPITGDLLSMTDPSSNVTHATYNAIGWQKTVTTARGNTTTVVPDAWGDPLSITDAYGKSWVMAYDNLRNLATRTDPDGSTTTFTWNADNELAKATRKDGTSWQTGYDGEGNVITQRDGLQHLTGYSWDALGHLSSVTDPLQRRTLYYVDAVGNLKARTDPTGQTTTYAYYGDNRLRSITYPGIATATTFGYDAAGRRSSMSDQLDTSTYAYDSLGNLAGVTASALASSVIVNGTSAALSSAPVQVSYGHDADGHLSSITYPTALLQATGQGVGTGTVQRSYWPDGQLHTVQDWFGHTTTYSYDADGNLSTVQLPNGVTTGYGYDNDDRLSAIQTLDPKGAALLQLQYTRTAGGLIQTLDPSGVPSSPTTTYSYDTTPRLAAATPSSLAGTTSPVASLGEDPADQLTSLISGPSGLQYGYDGAGELLSSNSSATGAVTDAYAYDLRGNRASMTGAAGDVSQYGWDSTGHMTAYSGPATSAVTAQASTNQQETGYTYDGDGLRSGKLVANTASLQTFTYDRAEGRPLLIGDGTASYITGAGGLPLEELLANGVVLYYTQDHLGSTRLLTNQAGNPVVTYRYSLLGTATPSLSSVYNPFQFAGLYADTESSLLYAGDRYYDPAVGQFISRAPMGTGPQRPYQAAGDDWLNAAPGLLSGAVPPAPIPGSVIPPSGTGTPWGAVLSSLAASSDAIGGGVSMPPSGGLLP